MKFHFPPVSFSQLDLSNMELAERLFATVNKYPTRIDAHRDGHLPVRPSLLCARPLNLQDN